MRIRTFVCITCTLALAALATLAGCSGTDPTPFNPESIRQIQRITAAQNQTTPIRELDTKVDPEYPAPAPGEQPRPRPPRPDPTTRISSPQRRMSLQEVINRVVANNPDVRVAGFQTAQDAARVIEALSRFDPVFFSNVQYQRQAQIFTDPTNPRTLETLQAQLGLKQNLPSGGQLELRLQQARNLQSFPAGTFATSPNPYITSELVLQLTQPLLQNFGTDVTRARINITRNDRKISLLDFQLKVEEKVAKAEENYWRLVFAIRDVAIQEQLLDATRTTADFLLKRWGQDVQKVQISQANAVGSPGTELEFAL